MILKLVATLLVVTPCVFALTAEEVAQFSDVGDCTVESGYTGASVTASLSGTTATITSNHVPNHEWESVNPNSPASSSGSYSFTTPTMLSDDQVQCLPQGAIAILKNGVLVYNPTTATGGNAYTDEVMDCNGGHSDNRGSYHYHSLPDNGVVYDSTNSASQFIGVAFDGLPIYSVGDGISTSDLDICHGMYVNGEYRYIASLDHFPYFLGCFRATAQRGSASSSCSGMVAGSVCTCQFGVINFNKKRALLDLLEEILSSKRTNPKLSWMNKRVNCGGTCGVSGSTTGGTTGGDGAPPTGGDGAPPTGGDGAPPTGGDGAPPTGGNGAPSTGGNGAPPTGGNGAPPTGGNGAPPTGGNGAPPTGGNGGAPPTGGNGRKPSMGGGRRPRNQQKTVDVLKAMVKLLDAVEEK